MSAEKNQNGLTAEAAVCRTLSHSALLLARVASADDARAAKRLATALRDPERVARLLEGIKDADGAAGGDPANAA